MAANVLAIDIGTSSTRVMLVNEKGEILHKEQNKYDVILVSKYMQEQNPKEIFAVLKQSIRECIQNAGVPADSIKALSFSSQMYHIFPIDEQGEPLMNMILWSDSRSEEQAERLKIIYGSKYIYEATGCPVNSLYPLSKLVWIREKREDIAKRAFMYISVKEYVMKEMIGEYVVDYSMASATGLFNIHSLKWDTKVLGIAGVEEEQFSRPVSGTECFPFINEALRRELLLPEGILVVPGGGDGPLANIGSGAYGGGIVNVDLGTSGAARIITDMPIIDDEERMWSYAVTEDSWVYGGILTNVGNGYNWLIRNIAEFAYAKSLEEIFDVMDKKLTKLPPASDDLLFLPYLIKCRSPYWDDKVKATVYGLTHEHTFVDIVKSYLESIGFDLFALVNIINEKSRVCKDVILTGGMAQSETMCQMLADILGKNIITLSSSEGSIMGAAIFALKALGELKELHFEKEMERDKLYETRMDQHISYQKKFVKYMNLRTAMYHLQL